MDKSNCPPRYNCRTYVTIILPDDLPEDAAPDPAFSIPDLAQDIGPEDLSRNLEHYLYCHPKQ